MLNAPLNIGISTRQRYLNNLITLISMLKDKYVKKIRKELEECTKPLFFYHDDPDGLCSFLLMYRKIREGKGIIIKSSPKIDCKFLRQVEEYQPDKIFILDIAIVDQDFLDSVKVPVIWVDHHQPLQRNRVKYFNPRIDDDKDITAVSSLCYQVVEQDLWIAALGTVADWQLNELTEKFAEEYPKLLSKKIKKPEKALFETQLGELIKLFSNTLKGKISEIMKSIKILTRIENPDELLLHDTARSKFLWKKHEKIEKDYEKLKKGIKPTKDKILLFTYPDANMSFTKELSNELLYKYPNKIIIIGREKSGKMKCSIRAAKISLPDKLQKALFGIHGFGGGHEHACGTVIEKEDFNQFIDNFKRELK